MLKQINYNSFTSLNSYDMLNKFNLKSIHEFPVYQTFELKTFIKEGSLVKATRLQMESFFLFYILGLNNVYLNFNYVTFSAARLHSVLIKSEVKSRVLKHLLLDFLFNFYLIINKYSRSYIISENALVFSKKSGKPMHKKINLISYLPANLLVEKREQTLINFNDLKIFISFQINQPLLYYSKKKNNKNYNLDSLYFKNIFPFWIFS